MPSPLFNSYHTLQCEGIGGAHVNESFSSYTTKEIAKELGISEKTVRNHISNTIQKLGVSSRAQAMLELIRLGEFTLE